MGSSTRDILEAREVSTGISGGGELRQLHTRHDYLEAFPRAVDPIVRGDGLEVRRMDRLVGDFGEVFVARGGDRGMRGWVQAVEQLPHDVDLEGCWPDA